MYNWNPKEKIACLNKYITGFHLGAMDIYAEDKNQLHLRVQMQNKINLQGSHQKFFMVSPGIHHFLRWRVPKCFGESKIFSFHTVLWWFQSGFYSLAIHLLFDNTVLSKDLAIKYAIKRTPYHQNIALLLFLKPTLCS